MPSFIRAINPFMSDVYALGDDKKEISEYGKFKSVWIKRAIVVGCGILTFALGLITSLSFPGILPIGLTGSIVFASASGFMLIITLIYLGGLGRGYLESRKDLKAIETYISKKPEREGLDDLIADLEVN